MNKPPLSAIPGAGVMSDTLDFVKNLWGSMNMPGMSLPGMAAPTLSVEELDKKISDLKAVESWLNVNMTMLRGTIQALEVQRGTIATLKSVGASFSALAKQAPGPATEKSLLESSPYASAFLYPNATPAIPKAAPPLETHSASPEPDDDADSEADAEADPQSISSLAALSNPLAWWSGLQEQFKQAVSTAAVSDTMAKLGAAGTAMATDAVVKLGEAAAKSTLAAKAPASKPDSTANKPSTSRAKSPAKASHTSGTSSTSTGSAKKPRAKAKVQKSAT